MTPSRETEVAPSFHHSGSRRQAYLWQAARLALGPATALGLARFSYGLLLPAMSSDLHWSFAQAGAMATANGVGYLAGVVAVPSIGRRLPMAWIFRWGMIGCVGSLAATALAGSYPGLLAARAAAGVGGAFGFVAGSAIASRLAAKMGSTAPIGIFVAGAAIGVVIAGTGIPVLLDQHPARWPLGWLAMAAVAVVATVVSAGATRAPDPSPSERPVSSPRPAHIRPLWRVVVAYTLFAAGYISYITFLSAYLSQHHWSAGENSLAWATIGLTAVAGPYVWRRLARGWHHPRTLATYLALIGVAACLPLLSASPVVVTGSALIYGVTFLGVPAAVTALAHDYVAPADRIPTLVALTALFAAGQTAGPWAAGALADLTTPSFTLGWTAVICALAALFAVRQPVPG
jgi:predicted MFS family arabinose efflux permease